MSDNNDVSGSNIPGCPSPTAAALLLLSPSVAMVAIISIMQAFSGCNSTGPAYDPETTCTVDTARAEIICRDKP